MKLAKELSEFFSRDRRRLAVSVLLILGLLLIFIGSFVGESDKAEANISSVEERAAEFCSLMDGVGECRVMITYTSGGDEVYGVLVLCDGADSAVVRERIVSAFTSILGIGSHRIEIQKLNREKKD